MLKALKYLKPFWLAVIAIVGLTFGQVQCELALPDAMSDIVTYGIQDGGVTESVPKAITSTTYDHLTLFMDTNDISVLENAYTKVTKGDVTYEKEYPAVQDQDIYILNEDAPEISSIMEKPFLIATMLENEEVLKKMNVESGEQLYQMIAMNPQIAEGIKKQADEMISGYTADNIKDAAILSVRSEYELLGMDTEKIQTDYILSAGLRMLGIAAAGSLLAVFAAFLAARTATGAARNMRNDVFKKVESFSSTEFSKFSTASLITRTTNDIQQVQNLLTMLLRIVLFAPFMGLTSLFKVLRYPEMFSLLLWIIAIIIVVMITTFCFALPKFKIIQKLVDNLNLVTREQLDGMLVIRAFNNEQVEEKKFDGVNKNITDVNIFVNRLLAVMQPIMMFLMSFVSILIVWFGAKQIDLGSMQIGAMMAFMQYAIHVLMSFLIVAAIFIMIPRSSVSAKRIFDVLETKTSINDPENPDHLPTENSTITFDHVCFRYPGAQENVLNDISFEAHPGETVAFIGSTGSGKSTLINLIPRFFDVSEGSIRFGNTDIRNVTQHELRDRIGYVPQKGILFSGTILSNLKYSDENASEDAVQNALKVSQAEEFVAKMPEGVNEPITEGGTNVSGGQKQRLSIARALTKQDAQVFIFDDTFSALDYKTDAKLREALSKMVESTKATVFIVAQRISTIRHADRIVVLNQGSVAGIGTHEELMQNCEVYKEIALSQLSSEELSR